MRGRVIESLTADLAIEAVRNAQGNITAAARGLGISRTTLYKFINNHATVKSALRESRETMLDNAESVLYKKVLEGEAWAVCFFLKTQGKSRGYVERQEITGAEGKPVVIAIGGIDPDEDI